MKYPILYAKNETDFFSLGLGVMTNTLEASVTEERNGSFYFESKIIIDVVIYPQLENDQLIKVDAGHELKDQRFRIKRIVDNHNGTASIYAEHISYLSAELSLKPEITVNGNGSTALTIWKSSLIGANSFVVDSDIPTSNSTNWRIDKVQNARQALGGVEGSILEKWGGEYRFDNYHISLLSKRGTTADVLLAYGRNITDFEQERNIANTFNSVYPFAIYTDDKQQEHLITLSGYFVDSSNIASFPNRKAQTVDFSNEFEHDVVPSQDKLKSLAQKYITTNGIGVPSVSIKVSFVDLSKISDYENIAPLEQLNLCDEVHVVYPKLKVNTTAKVVRVVWNVLAESYDEIEIGEKRVSLSDKISEQTKFINEVKTDANAASVSANGKNTNFYGLFGQDGIGEPKATKVGDLWYKPNGDKNELYQWNGTVWSFIISDDLQEAIEQAQTEVTEAKTAAQDAVDKANASVAAVQANALLINDVNAIANNAKTQAQTAATNAQTALTSANTANTNANKAIGDAGKLSEDVLALDTIANQAKSDADTALINANKGITDAKTALDKAIGVDTRVTTEITNVNNTVATKANSTTVDALSDTVSSQGTAISQNATDIKLKADSTVVNAIKGTVDNQGTLISQNSKDIALKANKTEVDTLSGKVSANETAIDITAQGVSTLVTKTDGTNTSLSQFKQDYEGFKGTVYSKTQTDTKVSTVQQSVDNFKTTVSSTYSSKAETDNKVTAVQANVDKLGTNIAYAWSQDGNDRFTRVKPNENIITQSPSGTSLTSTTTNNTDFFDLFKISQNYQKLSNWTTLNEVFTIGFSWESSIDLPDGASIGIFFAKEPWAWNFGSTNNVSGRKGSISKTGNNSGDLYKSIQTGMTIRLTNIPVGTIITITNVFVIAGSGKSFVLSSQDDYDNAVPRYIGRSLKDSNSPTEYKWEPNPERKPWTAYAQGVNGEDFSLMPYGENKILDSSFESSSLSLSTVNSATQTYDTSKKHSGNRSVKVVTSTTTTDTGLAISYSGLTVGVKYTLSVYVYTDNDNMTLRLRIANTSLTGQQQKTSIAKGDWRRVDYTFIAAYTSGFYLLMDQNVTFWVDDIKLELANTMNIPTPWTLAPSEDPLGAVPKYVGTAALPYEDPYKYEWRLSSDWNQVKTSTEFEQTDKEIALKANQADVNTITGRVSTAEGSISTIAGQIKLKANQTDVDTVIGRVTSAEGSISLISGQVALKANQADVNTTNGKVSSLESSFTVQSGKISALNTKTDGHTTQIGSLQSSYSGLTSTVASVENSLQQNNLVYNATLQGGSDGWVLEKGYTQSSARNINGNYIIDFSLASNQDKTWCFARSKRVPIGAYKTYSYASSLMRRTDIANNSVFMLGIEGFDSTGKRVEYKDANYNYQLTDDEWTVVSDSYTFTNSDVKTVCFTLATNGFGHYIACQPILVNDYKVGSFVPDGMDKGQITQMVQDLSGFKTTVANTYADKVSVASQITQSATAVTSNVQSWTNNKLTAYSTTQQTANSITNAVADKADKSQITQLSNQITSVVTDVSAIQVGGQNLLLGTATANTRTITQTNSFTITDPYDFSVSKLSDFNFEVDDYITLSFDWETTSTTGSTRTETNSTPYGFGNIISAKGTDGATSNTKTITVSEQRGHIEIVFKVSSTSKVSEASKLRLRFDNHQLNSTFTIKNAKLEKGNKATDWCIAPQEVASQSQITQLSDNINLRVSKGDVTSQINIEAGRTLIDTKQLLLNADNVKFSGSAFIPNSVIQNLSADKITAGTLNAANVNVINLSAKSLTAGTISGNNLSLNLDTGSVQFTKGYISGNNNKIRFDLDNSYLHSINPNGSGFKISDGQLSFYDGLLGSTPQYLGAITLDVFSSDSYGIKVYGNKGASIQGGGYGITIGYTLLGDNKIGLSGDTGVTGGLSVLGKLSVLGSKNAIHITRDGVRATPAYETAESYLGDIGGNYTREDCEVWVDIEKLFSDTVNTDIAYHVFLQAYDNARFWVSDFKSDKFLVRSDKPMARFAWEIKAKRRGYENDRLVIQEGFDNKILLDAQSKGIFKGGGEDE